MSTIGAAGNGSRIREGEELVRLTRMIMETALLLDDDESFKVKRGLGTATINLIVICEGRFRLSGYFKRRGLPFAYYYSPPKRYKRVDEVKIPGAIAEQVQHALDELGLRQ